MGMAGRRHWLTKYKDKESTFHNIVTFHITATYVGMRLCEMLWNVVSLSDGVLCQPVPPSIQPSLHLVDFF